MAAATYPLIHVVLDASNAKFDPKPGKKKQVNSFKLKMTLCATWFKGGLLYIHKKGKPVSVEGSRMPNWRTTLRLGLQHSIWTITSRHPSKQGGILASNRSLWLWSNKSSSFLLLLSLVHFHARTADAQERSAPNGSKRCVMWTPKNKKGGRIVFPDAHQNSRRFVRKRMDAQL